MRQLALTVLFAGILAAQPRTEEGEINGARFRIDIPENWNGRLVMLCHGYTPVTEMPARNNPDSPFFSRGYAVAASAYSATGWAVDEGADDTEALRRYFIRKYGQPKRTYIVGISMGGHISTELIERKPEAYDGALALCAVIAPAYPFLQRRAFDLRVVFDYYFPNVLPPPDRVPPDFRRSKAGVDRLLPLLEASPDKASAVRAYQGLKDLRELAFVVDFTTEVLAQVEARAGGNPFDNRNTLYDGVPDVNAVNDGVERYSPDPKAAAWLTRHFDLSGLLRRPLLEVHNTHDPLVAPWTVNTYRGLVEDAGSQDFFAVEYVKRDGHCNFQPAELNRALDELSVWVEKGQRPPVGELK